MAAGDFYKTASDLIVPRLNFARGTPTPHPHPCPGCCGEPCICPACHGSRVPRSWRVTFSGLANNNCSECVSGFNDIDFIVDECFVETRGVGSTWCWWSYELPSTICFGNYVMVAARDFGDEVRLQGALSAVNLPPAFSPAWIFNFSKGLAAELDCTTVIDQPLDQFSGANSQCDISGASCVVSAL